MTTIGGLNRAICRNLYKITNVRTHTESVSAFTLPAQGRNSDSYSISGVSVGDRVIVTPSGNNVAGLALKGAYVFSAGEVRVVYSNERPTDDSIGAHTLHFTIISH